jgi:hypothetical protein
MFYWVVSCLPENSHVVYLYDGSYLAAVLDIQLRAYRLNINYSFISKRDLFLVDTLEEAKRFVEAQYRLTRSVS